MYNYITNLFMAIPFQHFILKRVKGMGTTVLQKWHKTFLFKNLYNLHCYSFFVCPSYFFVRCLSFSFFLSFFLSFICFLISIFLISLSFFLPSFLQLKKILHVFFSIIVWTIFKLVLKNLNCSYTFIIVLNKPIFRI